MDGRDYQDFNSEEEGHGGYNKSANTSTNNSTQIEVPLGTIQSKETPSWWKVQLDCFIILGKEQISITRQESALLTLKGF